MVEESADNSYELCLINIHESVSACLWKTTVVYLSMSYGGVVQIHYGQCAACLSEAFLVSFALYLVAKNSSFVHT